MIAGISRVLNVCVVATSIKIKTKPKKNAIIIFPKNNIFLKTGVYAIKVKTVKSTIIVAL